MWIIILVVIGIIVFPILYINAYNTENERRENMQKKQQGYIEQNNIDISVEYSFQCGNIVDIRYIVDDTNKKVYIMLADSDFIEIPFTEIRGCEILTDSEVTGGVGRAVVGGVLAGGAGAVVGATTAKEHIKSYKIVIYRANIATPQAEISLISTSCKTTDSYYIEAVEFAGKVNASIRAIISINGND